MNFGVPRVILFLGAPGSGKGTQSSWLSAQLGVPCLSTGGALRSEAKRSSPDGVRLRRILASGSLVNDELVCAVVGARVRQEAPVGGLILDGFPRTVAQADYLGSLLAHLEMPEPLVVYLDVSTNLLLRRLTARRHCAVCGNVYNLLSRPSLRGPRCENDGGLLVERDDDAEGVVLRRLEEFESTSAPLIDYYRGADFHRIDGDRDLDLVAAELMEVATSDALCVAA